MRIKLTIQRWANNTAHRSDIYYVSSFQIPIEYTSHLKVYWFLSRSQTGTLEETQVITEDGLF